MLRGRRGVLFQTVGRPDTKGWWSDTRRSNLGRDAVDSYPGARVSVPPTSGPKTSRPGRPWTRAKLALLRYYLGGTSEKGGGFMVATRNARGRHYIDLFAGPGECRFGDEETIDGSP